jgi:hypothetical protein
MFLGFGGSIGSLRGNLEDYDLIHDLSTPLRTILSLFPG